MFGFFESRRKEKELMKKYNLHSDNPAKAAVREFTVFCITNMQKYKVKASEPAAAIAKVIDKTGFSAKSFVLQKST